MSRILLELKTSHGQNKDNITTRLDNNVSNAEKQAIKNLCNSEQVIVKPADKGGAIVIWLRESYIAEANKQLNDKQNYKLIETDPFPQLVTKLNKIVKTFFTDQLTDYTTLINQLGSLHYTCFLKYTNLTYREDQLSQDVRVPPSVYQSM
jgi:hypothetical protein